MRKPGRAVADEDAEARAAAALVDIDQAQVGLRVLAVGDDAPVLDAADEVPARRWSVHMTAKP
jgi:hypothetical protein